MWIDPDARKPSLMTELVGRTATVLITTAVVFILLVIIFS